jgi:hypothetical protein
MKIFVSSEKKENSTLFNFARLVHMSSGDVGALTNKAKL